MNTSGSALLPTEYNLKEISQKSGISVGYLSLIFNGKRTKVSLSVLTRLGFTLNLSIDEVRRLIEKSSEQARKRNKLEEAAEQKLNQSTQEERLKGLIQRTIQCLEHFDPLQLENIKREVESDLEELPLKYRLVKWIEGIQAARNNQFTTALDFLMEARMIRATKPYEKRMLAKIYGGMGSCYTALGDRKMAFKMFTKSLNIWGRGHDAGLVYLNMGTLYRRCHQYSRAKQAYLQAIEMGSLFIQFMAYSGLGQVALDQKKLDEARVILLKGYLISKKHPYTWGVPELYCNLGILYKLTSKYNLAQKVLSRAEQVAVEMGAIRVKHFIMIEQGEVLLLLHKVEEANEIFSNLEKELSDEGDILLLGKTLISVAKLLWNDSSNITLECLERCYKLLAQLEPSEELLLCCQLLVNYTLGRSDLGDQAFYEDEVKRIKKLLKK